jgi:hypothetical protein
MSGNESWWYYVIEARRFDRLPGTSWSQCVTRPLPVMLENCIQPQEQRFVREAFVQRAGADSMSLAPADPPSLSVRSIRLIFLREGHCAGLALNILGQSVSGPVRSRSKRALARFGPPTPTRATTSLAASVDPTDARKGGADLAVVPGLIAARASSRRAFGSLQASLRDGQYLRPMR